MEARAAAEESDLDLFLRFLLLSSSDDEDEEEELDDDDDDDVDGDRRRLFFLSFLEAMINYLVDPVLPL